MSETPAQRGSIRRLIGLVFIAAGALWIAASGLCSAGFAVTTFSEGGDFREALSIVAMIVLVGGFSIGIGFVLYAIGRALRPKE